ncbi:hypothetical protein [Aureimonas ureilytica]|uniref:hypothetical protein n=1 Tax=Aureimonas ureilytica TaxID=401562 RepID=UPI00073475A2|nr:hypothetical protein [Aureimonas ureilytica]
MADELYIIREGEKVAMTAEEIAAWKAEGPPAPLPTIVYPADLWRRATDPEGDAIYEAMQRQSRRIIELFRAAQTYQSDDELWPLLMGAATELFGADRAAELLAPSR